MAYATAEKEFFLIIRVEELVVLLSLACTGKSSGESFHFVFSFESVKNGRRFGLETDASFVNFPEFFEKKSFRGNFLSPFLTLR